MRTTLPGSHMSLLKNWVLDFAVKDASCVVVYSIGHCIRCYECPKYERRDASKCLQNTKVCKEDATCFFEYRGKWINLGCGNDWEKPKGCHGGKCISWCNRNLCNKHLLGRAPFHIPGIEKNKNKDDGSFINLGDLFSNSTARFPVPVLVVVSMVLVSLLLLLWEESALSIFVVYKNEGSRTYKNTLFFVILSVIVILRKTAVLPVELRNILIFRSQLGVEMLGFRVRNRVEVVTRVIVAKVWGAVSFGVRCVGTVWSREYRKSFSPWTTKLTWAQLKHHNKLSN